MPDPFHAHHYGCGAYVSGGPGHPPGVCGQEPTVAGLRWFPHTRHLWLVFACAAHQDQVDCPRPLEDRDRDEMMRRLANAELGRQGLIGWRQEEPLASGAEGRRRWEQAKQWWERQTQNGPADL